MSTISNRITTPLFSLLFAASLAFGTSTVFAKPPAAADCPVDYGSGAIGLACTVNSECTTPCNNFDIWSTGGHCRGGCCRCTI